MNIVENRKPYIFGTELRIPYCPTTKKWVDVRQLTDTKDHEMTSWGVKFLPKSHEIAVKIDEMRLKGDVLRLSIRVGGIEKIGLRVKYSEAKPAMSERPCHCKSAIQTPKIRGVI